jgi:phosphatidylserine/phosphatidylglycerophosphate/cardiolipin synthase-like enzyme
MKNILYCLLFLLSCSKIEQSNFKSLQSIGDYNCSITTWNVYFSPKGGATDHIVKVINSSKENIYVQAYSFTSKPIIDALINAKNRGIKVEIILDKSNFNNKQIEDLLKNNVIVYIDDKHAIAHNKIILIDNKKILTGSFNFSEAAEKSNAENLLSLNDSELYRLYYNNWNNHRQHSHIMGM